MPEYLRWCIIYICMVRKYSIYRLADFLHIQAAKGDMVCRASWNGETLLAKAVTAEAGVLFFVLSGSDFVEPFVGMGHPVSEVCMRKQKRIHSVLSLLTKLTPSLEPGWRWKLRTGADFKPDSDRTGPGHFTTQPI